jgi:hypothetical protein
MIVDPHPTLESVERKLAKLDDAELAEQLRLKNPQLFRDLPSIPRSNANLVALAFAAAGMFSVVAGFIIEPAIFQQHSNHATPASHRVPTHHRVAQHVRSHAASVAARPAAVTVLAPVAPHERIYHPRTYTRVAPHVEEKAQAHAQAAAVAQVQAQAQAKAEAEEQTWLRAQAQARAQDRARAAARAVPEVVIREVDPPAAPPKATGPVLNGGGPITQAPHPGIPWPVIMDPRCTPSRGVFIHTHSNLGSFLMNAALQNVRVGGMRLIHP